MTFLYYGSTGATSRARKSRSAAAVVRPVVQQFGQAFGNRVIATKETRERGPVVTVGSAHFVNVTFGDITLVAATKVSMFLRVSDCILYLT